MELTRFIAALAVAGAGAALVVTGATVLFGPVALVVAGAVMLVVGLAGVDVGGERR